MNFSRVWKGENVQHHRVDFGNRSRLKQVRGLAVAGAKRFPDELELPTVAKGGRIRYDVSSRYACRKLRKFSLLSARRRRERELAGEGGHLQVVWRRVERHGSANFP